MEIGERIKLARASRGLSISEAARRMDTLPQQWWRWENNGRAPSLSSLERIAGALDMKVTDVITFNKREIA